MAAPDFKVKVGATCKVKGWLKDQNGQKITLTGATVVFKSAPFDVTCTPVPDSTTDVRFTLTAAQTAALSKHVGRHAGTYYATLVGGDVLVPETPFTFEIVQPPT